MTSQDFKKRIDLTALETVTGSEMNQLIDAATVAGDKGIRIITQDSAIDTPDVPDPEQTLEGLSCAHWKRYQWVRLPYTGSTAQVKEYNWNDNLSSHAVLLKWEIVYDREGTEAIIELNSQQILALQSDVETLESGVTTAQNLANNAKEESAQAAADAANALSKANEALVGVSNLDSRVTILEAADPSLETILPIANGGTGADNVTQARENLSLRRAPLGSFYLYDQKTQGVNGGSFTSGAWRDRELTTLVIDNSGLQGYVSLDATTGIFTVFKGVWAIEVLAPALNVANHQARLVDTEGAVYAYGSTAYSGTDQDFTHSIIKAGFELGTLKTMKIQHRCTGGYADSGFGIAANLGPEIYTIVKLTYLGV